MGSQLVSTQWLHWGRTRAGALYMATTFWPGPLSLVLKGVWDDYPPVLSWVFKEMEVNEGLHA